MKNFIPKCQLLHIAAILWIFTALGCTTPTKPSQTLMPVAIQVTGQDRVQFSGKGSAAGMMMSSSMGLMGIAIGIAIDEGIAKDIATTAEAAQLNFSEILYAAIQHQGQQQQYTMTMADSQATARLVIDIEKYGFKVVPGTDDLISAEINLKIHPVNEEPVTVNYPDDFSESDHLATMPLEALKTDSAAIASLWEDASHEIAQRIFAVLTN